MIENEDHEKRIANSTAIGACLPLRFLLNKKQRKVSRAQMPDLSDSAIFYRMWNLFSLEDPAVRVHLTGDERAALDAFNDKFHALPWEATLPQQHLRTLKDENLLDSIRESGRALHNLLIRRQRIPLLRRIKLKIQGWP